MTYLAQRSKQKLFTFLNLPTQHTDDRKCLYMDLFSLPKAALSKSTIKIYLSTKMRLGECYVLFFFNIYYGL